MIYSHYNCPVCPPNIICFSGEHITESMLNNCFAIDDLYFNSQYIYDRRKIKQIIIRNNELCFVFYDLEKNKVVGYNFILLLKQSSFKKYLGNEISYFTLGLIDVCNKQKNTNNASLFYLSTAYEPNSDIMQLLSVCQNCITDELIKLKHKNNIEMMEI